MSRQLAETVKANPNLLPKSMRHEEVRVGTSGVCGKFIPVKAIPLLREDRASGMVSVNLKLDELSERLVNPIVVRAYAYLVPKLAADRFQDMGSVNRSYQGEQEVDGNVIPWFKTMPFDANNAIFKTMGLHAATGDQVNDEYVEAYNIIWNYRAQKRSRDLTERTALDSTLAPALWPASEMAGILSSFDQAQIDAEVPISFLDNRLPVSGIGKDNPGVASNDTNVVVSETNFDSQGTTNYPKAIRAWSSDPTDMLTVRTDDLGRPQVYAETQNGQVTMSMSLMEMAKKAAQQAHVKEKYKDVPLEHIVDLLMEGINVPEELMNRPILLDRVETIFGYSTRYATDSGNLEKSVTEGMTSVDLQFFTPQINTGGVIMICLEVVPERVYERQMDHYFLASSRDDVPNNLADYLDPEKVSIVQNKEIDVQHNTPDATFGYRPLNKHWERDIPTLGGKFYRNDPAAPANENRNRIWASEVANPTLTEDWYLATTLNDNPFVVQGVDHLEITADGSVGIVGLTQMGKRLVEDSNSYQEILDQVDQSSIDQDA